jgi:hypothetical protein
MYDEEEVPNVKRMRVVEEEVSLSQSKIVMPLLEEEEVPVPQGTTVVVPPKEEVPPEEEVFPTPAVAVPPDLEEVLAAPLVVVPPEGRRCLVPVPAMVSSLPFFFLKKA